MRGSRRKTIEIVRFYLFTSGICAFSVIFCLFRINRGQRLASYTNHSTAITSQRCARTFPRIGNGAGCSFSSWGSKSLQKSPGGPTWRWAWQRINGFPHCSEEVSSRPIFALVVPNRMLEVSGGIEGSRGLLAMVLNERVFFSFF